MKTPAPLSSLFNRNKVQDSSLNYQLEGYLHILVDRKWPRKKRYWKRQWGSVSKKTGFFKFADSHRSFFWNEKLDLSSDCQVREIQIDEEKYCFVLETEDKDFTFMTESSDERNNWIRMFYLITTQQGEMEIKGVSCHLESWIFSKGYQLICELGRGATATVKLFRTTKEIPGERNSVAIKCLNRSMLKKMRQVKVVKGKMVVSTGLDQVQVEIAIMKKINHPNIMRLYEVLDDDEETLALVLEYLSGGQVMEWNSQEKRYTSKKSKPLSNQEIQHYFRCIVQGLDYLHSHRICHRDIKPENILLSEDGICKIADFGVAHAFDDQEESTGLLGNTAGTYAFMSPESIQGGKFSGYAADIWALGVTLYALLWQNLPFYADNADELFNLIEKGNFEIPKEVDESLKDLLMGLLRYKSDERFTIEQIKKHPWSNKGYPVEQHLYNMVQPDCVEVSSEDIAVALTPINGLALFGMIKIQSRRWVERAHKSSSNRVIAELCYYLKGYLLNNPTKCGE